MSNISISLKSITNFTQILYYFFYDYGNIYVHIFLPEYREYYNLEQLWNDARIAEIPDLD